MLLTEGHTMEKATWLLGDLPSLACVARKFTKHDRKRLYRRREKKGIEVPYVKGENGKVHGLPELAESAVYPVRFCKLICKIWFQDFRAFQGRLAQMG